MFNSLPHNHTILKSYEKQEAHIQRALIHHESDLKLKFTKLIKIYNVLYQHLLAHTNSREDHCHSGGENKVLTIDQETALYQIIDHLEHNRMHCYLSIVSSIANFILRNTHDDPEIELPTVAKNWTSR